MHHRLTIALFAILISLSGVVSAAPSPAPQCFQVPGITNCIDGRFGEYWNGNGGLPVFGFPITPQRPENNRDTNQSYQTQWFERNRFELHPENQAPYDVLLGRLGAEGLTRLGRGFEASAGQPQGRCRTFDVGGKPQYVCDPFLRYWEANGLEFDGKPGKSYEESLALFGLPLTAPKRETNPNGDTVTTQWFERARFEDHGTKGVLLGLLGNESLSGTTPPLPPTPTSPPAPPPVAPPANTRLCSDVPASFDGWASPNCKRSGGSFILFTYGFAAEERLQIAQTAPDGSVVQMGTYTAFRDGVFFEDWGIRGNPAAPGVYTIIVTGQTSGHRSVVYFKVLP